MATVYKLTNTSEESMGGMTWGAAVSHSASGSSTQALCSDGWIHVYESAVLAVMLNPIHVALPAYHIWQSTGTIGKRKQQVKAGCTSLTTDTLIANPTVTNTHRIKFGILSAQELCHVVTWLEWAEAWLANTDRTEESALAIARTMQTMATAALATALESLEVATAVDTDAAALGRRARERHSSGALEPSLADAVTAVLAAAAVASTAAEIARCNRAKQLLTDAGTMVSAFNAARAAIQTDNDALALCAARAAAACGDAADARGLTIDFVAIGAAAVL